MNNKGVMGPLASLAVIVIGIAAAIVIGVGGLVALGWYSPGGGVMQTITGGGGTSGGFLQTTQVCDDNGQAVINFRLKNGENTASAEWMDAMAYLYQKVGSSWVNIQNKTLASDGTYTAFTAQPCLDVAGKTYTYQVRILSEDGASGDNSYISGLGAETSTGVTRDGGNVDIVLLGNAYVTAIGSQHATLSFRMKDLNADGLMYDTGDTEAQTYETTGVVFTSAVGATTNMTVAGGGSLDVDLQIEGVQSDTLFNGDGPGSVLLFINGDVATWTSDGTSVNCGNGGAVKLAKSDLRKTEQEKYSNQEFVYQVNAPLTDDPVTHCEIKMKAQANPASNYCPVITLVSRGNYISSTDGSIVQNSAVKDDSSYTLVYTAATATIEANVNSINGCTAST